MSGYLTCKLVKFANRFGSSTATTKWTTSDGSSSEVLIPLYPKPLQSLWVYSLMCIQFDSIQSETSLSNSTSTANLRWLMISSITSSLHCLMICGSFSKRGFPKDTAHETSKYRAYFYHSLTLPRFLWKNFKNFLYQRSVFGWRCFYYLLDLLYQISQRYGSNLFSMHLLDVILCLLCSITAEVVVVSCI